MRYTRDCKRRHSAFRSYVAAQSWHLCCSPQSPPPRMISAVATTTHRPVHLSISAQILRLRCSNERVLVSCSLPLAPGPGDERRRTPCRCRGCAAHVRGRPCGRFKSLSRPFLCSLARIICASRPRARLRTVHRWESCTLRMCQSEARFANLPAHIAVCD